MAIIYRVTAFISIMLIISLSTLLTANAMLVTPSRAELIMMQGASYTLRFKVTPPEQVDKVEIDVTAGYTTGLAYRVSFDTSTGIVNVYISALRPGTYVLALKIYGKMPITPTTGVIARPALSVPIVVFVPGVRIDKYFIQADAATGHVTLCLSLIPFSAREYRVSSCRVTILVDNTRIVDVNTTLSKSTLCFDLGVYPHSSTHNMTVIVKSRYSVEAFTTRFRVGLVTASLRLTASAPSFITSFFGAILHAHIEAIIEYNTTRCKLELYGSLDGAYTRRRLYLENTQPGFTIRNTTELHLVSKLPPVFPVPLRTLHLVYGGSLRCLGVPEEKSVQGVLYITVLDLGVLATYIVIAALIASIVVYVRRRARREARLSRPSSSEGVP